MSNGLRHARRTLHLTTYPEYYEVRGNYTGVSRKDLEVQLHGRQLTVRARRCNDICNHGS